MHPTRYKNEQNIKTKTHNIMYRALKWAVNIYKKLAYALCEGMYECGFLQFSVLQSGVNSLELQVRLQQGQSWGLWRVGVEPPGGRPVEVSGEGSRAARGQILGFSRSPAAGCESGCAAADHSFAWTLCRTARSCRAWCLYGWEGEFSDYFSD